MNAPPERRWPLLACQSCRLCYLLHFEKVPVAEHCYSLHLKATLQPRASEMGPKKGPEMDSFLRLFSRFD